MLRNRVVRGGVEPPTFRFSGITTTQVGRDAAAWTGVGERVGLALVAGVAVIVAVSSAGVNPRDSPALPGHATGTAGPGRARSRTRPSF
jgi:hypothetical protein